ncbi:type II and III secretion system protein family protein [Novosphingopyxis sp.]|uniref:type II and III secretion system protein family protein n=1 Tax=Novosphingopyxis sp. TaxID=2709690 RepID=UPI003B5B75BD
MITFLRMGSGSALLALAAAAIAAPALLASAPAAAQQTDRPTRTVTLSVGRGEQVNLPSSITDVFVADPSIADVQVTNPRQLYLFGKATGETTFYATNAAGKTVYSAIIRTGRNIETIDQMLQLAMPEATLQTNSLNGVTLLTGTVANPEDAAEAERLVQAFVGDTSQVVSRIRTKTPLQVNLRVRIAEVSRSLAKQINGNLATRDTSGGFLFGVTRGRDFVDIGDSSTAGLPVLDASSQFGLPAGSISLPFDPSTGRFVTGGGTNYNFKIPSGTNVLQAAGRLFGLDVAAALDLSETAGLISTLAEPNLTTVSGETAEFLAGGEFPIPISNGLGSTSVEFRNYGVQLQYTPTVLANGRISLRVRPEVSDISSVGAVRFGGTEIPAIITRRAETTVELGSGQSFMIAGLLSNSSTSSVEKLPGAGDIPILGNLFKSNGWRRNETELMIIVTPYLVEPVSDHEIVLPTDGYQSPNDAQRLLLNRQSDGVSGATRPMPTIAPEAPAGPVVGDSAPPSSARAGNDDSGAAPGFSFE